MLAREGQEFWSDDKTEGYRVVKDIEDGTYLVDALEPLGNASKPEPYGVIPDYLSIALFGSRSHINQDSLNSNLNNRS